MKVNVQFREEENVLKGFVEGEIDTFTASVLRQELDAVTIEKGQQIELDLSKVSYLDSTGLGIFVAFYKKITREQAELKFVGLTARLLRLFEITGLSELMNIEYDDNDEKVEYTNERI